MFVATLELILDFHRHLDAGLLFGGFRSILGFGQQLHHLCKISVGAKMYSPALVMTVIHLVLISSDSVCNKIVCGADGAPDLATGMTVTSNTKDLLVSFWGFTEDIRRFHRFLLI